MTKPQSDPEPDSLWEQFGIDDAFLTTSADSLVEKRNLHSGPLRHFEVAGSLIRFSRQDFKLASAAFFHAVLGLEAALKVYYQSTKGYLRPLLKRAFDEGLIADTGLGNIPNFTPEFERMMTRHVKRKPASYTEYLVQLIPKLRNEYMHGEYILTPDFLHLALQVRTLADLISSSGRGGKR